MSTSLKIVMAQLNFLVGDIEGNTDKIIAKMQEARDELKGDLVIFPELAITGYPPEDLLLRRGLYLRVKKSLDRLVSAVHGIDVIVGYPWSEDNIHRYNALAHISNQKIVTQYFKQCLPNYAVFDEERYFTPGDSLCVTSINNIPMALSICEDMWFPELMAEAKAAKAQLMISINASPFDLHKPETREKIMAHRAKEGQMPLIYVNTVGGQDELVFDGGSMALSAEGKILHHSPFYEEILDLIELRIQDNSVLIESKNIAEPICLEGRIYHALVLGLRDYVSKNGFRSVVMGLSGGIDSALSLAIAVDAIGADQVEGLLMPSRYTTPLSITGAQEEADILGIKAHTISIEPMLQAALESLATEFQNLPVDATEENIQARIRGIILMAVSNKLGAMVISTGNKSELSVGFCTLYGDMVGGFGVIKDIPKTWVYRLAKYRNSLSYVIPQAVINRPPTAELAKDQLDTDSLPPYDILDEILELSIEQDESLENIVAKGYDRATVEKVIQMIDRNEYKRRQAPLGVRVSQKAFGRDRRYPITSGFNRRRS
jgi:NAD+ synthase (glutamine-hydrolysing)